MPLRRKGRSSIYFSFCKFIQLSLNGKEICLSHGPIALQDDNDAAGRCLTSSRQHAVGSMYQGKNIIKMIIAIVFGIIIIIDGFLFAEWEDSSMLLPTNVRSRQRYFNACETDFYFHLYEHYTLCFHFGVAFFLTQIRYKFAVKKSAFFDFQMARSLN